RWLAGGSRCSTWNTMPHHEDGTRLVDPATVSRKVRRSRRGAASGSPSPVEQRCPRLGLRPPGTATQGSRSDDLYFQVFGIDDAGRREQRQQGTEHSSRAEGLRGKYIIDRISTRRRSKMKGYVAEARYRA